MQSHLAATVVRHGAPAAAKGTAATANAPGGQNPHVTNNAPSSVRRGGANDNAPAGSHYAEAQPHRHLTQTEERVGNLAEKGEALMPAVMMTPLAGMGVRHTLGRAPGAVGDFAGRYIGGVSYAFRKAMDTSWSNARSIPANFFHAWNNYATGNITEFNGKTGLAFNKGREPIAWVKRVADRLGPEQIRDYTKTRWTGAKNLKGLLAWLPKQSVLGTMLIGALTIASGFAAWKAGRQVSGEYKELDEVATDYLGRPPAKEDWERNPVLKEMRGNIKARAVPIALEGLANAGQNAAFAAMGNPVNLASGAGMFSWQMMASLGAGQAAGMAAGSTPDINGAQAYLDIKQLLSEGKTPAPFYYAQLMATVHPPVRQQANSAVVEKIATDYADAKTNPAQLLKDFESGALQQKWDQAAKDIASQHKANKAPNAADTQTAAVRENAPTPTMQTPNIPDTAALKAAEHHGKMQQPAIAMGGGIGGGNG